MISGRVREATNVRINSSGLRPVRFFGTEMSVDGMSFGTKTFGAFC